MNTTSGNSYNFFEEEDEEAKNERQEIRENVNNAMRDGNLFREKNSFNEVSTEENSNVDDVNENIENKDTTQPKDTNTGEFEHCNKSCTW